MLINISGRKTLSGKISSFSSEADSSHKAENLLSAKGSWITRRSGSVLPEFIIIDFGTEVYASALELEAAENNCKLLPSDFRFETSMDTREWKIVHSERNFSTDEKITRFPVLLSTFRYLKLFISKTAQKDNQYFCEIAGVSALIAGIAEITCGSTAPHGRAPSSLFDDNGNSFWEPEASSNAAKEILQLDLGQPFTVGKLTIKSHQNIDYFPETFSIESSTDKKVWMPLISEKRFKAEPGKIYSWSVDAVNARYIRMEAARVKHADVFNVCIGKMAFYAAPVNDEHTHINAGNPPHASVFQGGLVRLAKDGEDTKGTAVQADDRRLRDGTTLFKGIVQLAANGESKEGLVLQSTDDRIKPATETREGIVRLGYEGERKAGCAVQGSDPRLKEAADNSFGIVTICPDGAYSEIGVVRGNDSRLKRATVENAGIVRLAKDGENAANCAVQGNDRRLKDASTSAKGIVKLADDGEDKIGVVVQGNDKRLKDATISVKGIVKLADDGEDRPAVAVQGNDRRLKDATTSSKGIVKLADDGEDKTGVAVQGNDKRLKDATEHYKGILRFAKDGESIASTAVQGNDKRLKDATDQYKGIVRLAKDGEDAPLTAVQGDDKRLKDATTITKGIVELADDGEDRAGVAVQGNDKRLRDATTSAKGIVELADDGENRAGVAVQGNDKRLRDATTSAKGIIELADDGENRAGVAVQGNDKRLKDATELTKGILRFAKDGEDTVLAAVQGNDKRLKDATTFTKGIVELAEDGEVASEKVVQGNDKRLKDATTSTPGIVRLAENGANREGSAVQSNDARLADKREPLPHTHEYAHVDHDFSSHKGTISVKGNKAIAIQGITPPPADAGIISAENTSSTKGGAALIGAVKPESSEGINGYGVIGHSPFVGVRGQATGAASKEKGCGILGISRFGAGGVFSSEHDYSIVVNGFGKIEGYDCSAKLLGAGKAMHITGDSVIQGSVALKGIKNDAEQPGNIAEFFRVDNDDHISAGDILAVSDMGGAVLTKTKEKYMTSVIGIVTGKALITINNSGEEEKIYPVALCGKVICKVDAKSGAIKPGDLIVSSDNPGYGMKGTIDSFGKVGSVIGKALEGIESGSGNIMVFISAK
jgi:hypothetical protein